MSISSIGIDVSKKTLDICLLLQDGSAKHLQVANNQSGVPSVVEKLISDHVKEATPIVIEATGGYHYRITFSLQEKGFQKVAVINPLITKKYLKSAIRKTKTDKIDAQLLAKIALNEKLFTYTETKQDILVKRKIRLRHFLKKQLQQVKTKLNSVKHSVISDPLEEKMLKRLKQELETNIRTVEKEILACMTVQGERLVGVSELSLKAILGELGDTQRFSNRKQIVAFAGLDPTVRESGSSVRGKSTISKRGSKTLRHHLFQAAWGVKMHNPKFQKYYAKKRAEGKHYYTCLIAVSRKLLCEIYTMRKKGTLNYILS